MIQGVAVGGTQNPIEVGVAVGGIGVGVAVGPPGVLVGIDAAYSTAPIEQ